MKRCFDSSLALIAILLSLVFLHAVVGIREGTVIAALLVGPLVRLFSPAWRIFTPWLRPER